MARSRCHPLDIPKEIPFETGIILQASVSWLCICIGMELSQSWTQEVARIGSGRRDDRTGVAEPDAAMWILHDSRALSCLGHVLFVYSRCDVHVCYVCIPYGILVSEAARVYAHTRRTYDESGLRSRYPRGT